MKNYVFAVSIAAPDKERITSVEAWMEDTHALKFELRLAIRAAICKHGGFDETCADVKARVKTEFHRLLKIARKKRKKAQGQQHQAATTDRPAPVAEDKECKVIKRKKTYLTPYDIRWLLIHEFGVPAPTKAQLKHLFRILDKDQSGRIDFDEFYNMLFDELDLAEHERRKQGKPSETLEAEFTFHRKFIWEDHNLYYWPSPIESLSAGKALLPEQKKLLMQGEELIRVEVKEEKTQLVLYTKKDNKVLRGSQETIAKWCTLFEKYLMDRDSPQEITESKESPVVTMEPEPEKSPVTASELHEQSSETNLNVELVTLHGGGVHDELDVA